LKTLLPQTFRQSQYCLTYGERGRRRLDWAGVARNSAGGASMDVEEEEEEEGNVVVQGRMD
jgi:hypothetical protein